MKLLKQKEEAVKALNVRGFPAGLLWACRQKAAAQQVTLKEFIIATLAEAVKDQPKR